MILRFLISGLAGLLGGGLIALFLAFGPAELGGVRMGPWQTNPLIGSTDADPVMRAIIARRGLLALRQTETIYFSADHDDQGRQLVETCRYRMNFTAEPQARWWSVTLYASDEYLAVNGLNAHSFSADHAANSPASVAIAAERPPGPDHWVSSANAGAFNLTLRLYHPDDGVLADVTTANLPTIERLNCEGQS
jgi:hypothetical protein